MDAGFAAIDARIARLEAHGAPPAPSAAPPSAGSGADPVTRAAATHRVVPVA